MPARKSSSKPVRSETSKKVTKATPAAPSTASLDEYNRKRDFTKTAEPRGAKGQVTAQLSFVIQKHAATRLHFDFRLELDGVMKSWAVPRGPSLDPADKRLAMEVEDHPIDYNTFEGIIPKGQYGGGTVMLWDAGIYTYGNDDMDPVQGLRHGYLKGDLKIVLLGQRLQGSFVLVRTKRGKPGKNEWLLIKHKDPYAKPGFDVVKEFETSVVTGRTMQEIAAQATKVWNSNRP
jgi:bifunctional non-homologous end joining protein LigD